MPSLMPLPISFKLWRTNSPDTELCNAFSPVQHTSSFNLPFPPLEYINHMFALSTKVTLTPGTHAPAHKAAPCFCALSGGRCACAKHINPPRRQGEQKPRRHGRFDCRVRSPAGRSEGPTPGGCPTPPGLPSVQVHCSGAHPEASANLEMKQRSLSR